MSPRPLTRDEMAAKLLRDTPRVAERSAASAEQYLNLCMADQERARREPWRDLTCDRTTEARGRHGWCILDHGDMLVGTSPDPRTWLRLWAKRQGDTPPIMLQLLRPDDMRRRGPALTQAAEAYSRDGAIAMETNAVVSQGAARGAYVAAWVWVGDRLSDDDAEEAPNA